MARRAGKKARSRGARGAASRRHRLGGKAAARAAERFRRAALDHQAGRLGAAEEGYREVLAAAPDHPGAALNYALLARATGRIALALELARQAAEVQPDEPAAHNTLGSLLFELHRTQEAAAAYRAALEADPDHLNARFNLGKALQRAGEPEAAAAELRVLAERRPDDFRHWMALGAALLDAGRPEDALAAQRRALTLRPGHPDVLGEMGLAHVDRGEFDEAARCYRRVLDTSPDHAHVWLDYAKTRRFGPGDHAEIDRAERAAARLGGARDGGTAQGDVHFALGKMYDDLGEVDRAFDHYRQGNEILRRYVPFDPDELARLVADLEAAFDAAWFERVRGWGNPSPRPVFIVGMPRSGTTLVEQILASHPEVHGAGELIRIPNLAERLFAPGSGLSTAARALGSEAVAAAAQDYLEYIAARAGDAPRVTDKLPENYRHLGLIAALFPAARIVHVHRDPIDVCVSNYFVRFAHGHGYSYGLADLAHEYRGYEQLMRHWRRTLPAASIRDQSYERLVESLERESRALVEFCGLDWDDRCLAFHRTERPVHTASGWQVRQPIYRRAVERWRRYEAHLGPLLEALRRAGTIPP